MEVNRTEPFPYVSVPCRLLIQSSSIVFCQAPYPKLKPISHGLAKWQVGKMAPSDCLYVWLSITDSINDTQHNNAMLLGWLSSCWVSHFIYCYAECHYTECRYAECRYVECRYAECRSAPSDQVEISITSNFMFQGSIAPIDLSDAGVHFIKFYFLRQWRWRWKIS